MTNPEAIVSPFAGDEDIKRLSKIALQNVIHPDSSRTPEDVGIDMVD